MNFNKLLHRSTVDYNPNYLVDVGTQHSGGARSTVMGCLTKFRTQLSGGVAAFHER